MIYFLLKLFKEGKKMSINNVLWDHREEVLSSFDNAILYGILNTWERCRHMQISPQATDFMAGFMLNSSHLLYTALESLLSPSNIATSIYVAPSQQKAGIQFVSGQPGCCTLGDILLAYVHKPKTGILRRNALLLKAVSTDKESYQVSSGEYSHLHLFRDWPDFEYDKPCQFKGQRCSITPKAPHTGAQFILIDKRSPSDPESSLLKAPEKFPISCCMSEDTLYPHNDFSSELFNFLTFCSGRPFDESDSSKFSQGWSGLIWDLLAIGIKKAYTGERIDKVHFDSVKDAIVDGSFYAYGDFPKACSTIIDILGEDTAELVYNPNVPKLKACSDCGQNFHAVNTGVPFILIETEELE